MGTAQVTTTTGNPPAERRAARIPDRIFAAFFDSIVLLPGFVATVVLLARWNHVPTSEDGTIKLVGGPALEAMFLCVLIVSLYSFFLEGFCGKTLGKEVMGIDVRSSTGGLCGLRGAFVRNLLRPIDAIGFYLLGFAFLCVADRIADVTRATALIDHGQSSSSYPQVSRRNSAKETPSLVS